VFVFDARSDLQASVDSSFAMPYRCNDLSMAGEGLMRISRFPLMVAVTIAALAPFASSAQRYYSRSYIAKLPTSEAAVTTPPKVLSCSALSNASWSSPGPQWKDQVASGVSSDAEARQKCNEAKPTKAAVCTWNQSGKDVFLTYGATVATGQHVMLWASACS
jgi:hypothetical protein